MAVFVCPACGYAGNAPDKYTSYQVMCTKCGKTATVKSKLKSGSRSKKQQKEEQQRKTMIKGMLVVAAIGIAATIWFVLIAPRSSSTKTQLFDLDKAKVDQTIMQVGIFALEDEGWTKPETAFYIESRIQRLKVQNMEARDVYRSRGLSGNGLNAKSNASDVQGLDKTELKELNEEIADRANRITEFERILAEYRQSNPAAP